MPASGGAPALILLRASKWSGTCRPAPHSASFQNRAIERQHQFLGGKWNQEQPQALLTDVVPHHWLQPRLARADDHWELRRGRISPQRIQDRSRRKLGIDSKVDYDGLGADPLRGRDRVARMGEETRNVFSLGQRHVNQTADLVLLSQDEHSGRRLFDARDRFGELLDYPERLFRRVQKDHAKLILLLTAPDSARQLDVGGLATNHAHLNGCRLGRNLDDQRNFAIDGHRGPGSKHRPRGAHVGENAFECVQAGAYVLKDDLRGSRDVQFDATSALDHMKTANTPEAQRPLRIRESHGRRWAPDRTCAKRRVRLTASAKATAGIKGLNSMALMHNRHIRAWCSRTREACAIFGHGNQRPRSRLTV